METMAGTAREKNAVQGRFVKTRHNARRGFSLVDLLLVIAVLLILGVMLIPIIGVSNTRSPRITCTSNLKQVGLAFRFWAEDHQYAFPQAVSVTNGGAMEAVMDGNVAAVFQVMSNELNTPKILLCPTDKKRIQATTFEQSPSKGWHKSVVFLGNTNLSYFVGLDAKDTSPDMFLSGDDNFLLGGNYKGDVGGSPVPSGVLILTTNSPVTWSEARHEKHGNIGLADGSVQGFSSHALRTVLKERRTEPNRLALP